LRQSLAVAGRETVVASFSAEAMARSYDQLYCELVA